MKDTDILFIISKIFNDYDEKNGVIQKVDYTQRAKDIIDAWQSVNNQGLNIELICKLHRIICNNEDIAINDEQGNIIGYTKAGEYRTHPSSRKSELHNGKRTLFFPPEQIKQRMHYLTTTMNSVFASNQSKDMMIENIVAFTVEFLTVHPFANQNGRLAQVLMELFAFKLGIEPFNISFILTNYKHELIKSLEEIRNYKNINSFLILQNKAMH